MPIDNSLNVSELFRRLGIKGDSLGSAPLLESLRLSLLIGDLSQLVPPLAGPYAGANHPLTSGVGTVNKWSLECRSPGGLRVQTVHAENSQVYNVWVTPVSPFGAILTTAVHNFSFGQAAQSVFHRHTPAAGVSPANAFRLEIAVPSRLPENFQTWIGPGEFFNIEAINTNISQVMTISWQEYPGALNPG